MPVVLVELPDGRGLRAVEDLLADEETRVANDLHYIVAIARTAADLLPEVERFIISYTQFLETVLTPRDVWLLIAEEEAISLPRPPICPFFCTHGYSCGIPWRGVHRDTRLAASEVALRVRNFGRAARDNWPHILAPRGYPAPGWLPLGPPAFRQQPPKVMPIAERPVDVTFRGTLGGGRSFGPKALTRARMSAAVNALPHDLNVDFVDKKTFEASYFSPDPETFVQSLLDAKICLAPRGGSLETWRVFEGALAGCVIVTDPKPPAWYYRGLPRWELRSWADLPGIVEELLEHPELMQSMSNAARDWSLNVVSPEAVGRWVARRVREDPPGVTRDVRTQTYNGQPHRPAAASRPR